MRQYSNMSSSFDYVKCETSATFLTSRCESIILGKEGQCKYVELLWFFLSEMWILEIFILQKNVFFAQKVKHSNCFIMRTTGAMKKWKIHNMKLTLWSLRSQYFYVRKSGTFDIPFVYVCTMEIWWFSWECFQT